MNTTLRCVHCDDPIGMYEPIVVVGDADAQGSLRSAEQGRNGQPPECYHRDCYVRVHGAEPAR